MTITAPTSIRRARAIRAMTPTMTRVSGVMGAPFRSEENHQGHQEHKEFKEELADETLQTVFQYRHIEIDEQTEAQSGHQGPFINDFQEPRPQQPVYFDGCPNDLMSDLLVFARNRFVAHFRSSFVLFVSFVVGSAGVSQSGTSADGSPASKRLSCF